MAYTTVFDVATAGPRFWWFAPIGLILVIPGWFLARRPEVLVAAGLLQSPKDRRFFRWCFFLFACIWTAIAAISVFGAYLAAVHDLSSGRFSIVSGRVEHFHPMPSRGHAMESFEAHGVAFDYSDDVVTAGFNQTAAHGGPIREGLPVRIAYRGNVILRLEVGR
jgi:hypothetical protein